MACMHVMEFYLTMNLLFVGKPRDWKITRATSRIALGLQDKLYLGNLDAKRTAMPKIMSEWCDDFASRRSRGLHCHWKKTTSVREFAEFAEVGVELTFKGEGENEKGFVKSCNNPKFKSNW
jgi:GDPmannose 4,6-dehydratase